jgi:hypothetical protein
MAALIWVLPTGSREGVLLTLVVAVGAGLALYLSVMAKLRSPELASFGGLLARRSG